MQAFLEKYVVWSLHRAWGYCGKQILLFRRRARQQVNKHPEVENAMKEKQSMRGDMRGHFFS